MRPLTVTLPPESYQSVVSGEKRMIATKRNARKDKYFESKTPAAARINGHLYRITRITGTPTEWRVYIAP